MLALLNLDANTHEVMMHTLLNLHALLNIDVCPPKFMMHALLNYDARSPKIMMNAEGKVKKRLCLIVHSVCKFSLDRTQCVRKLSKRCQDADFPLPQIDA